MRPQNDKIKGNCRPMQQTEHYNRFFFAQQIYRFWTVKMIPRGVIMKEGKEKKSLIWGHFRSCTSMGEPYALVLVVTCRGMNSASLRRPPNAFCGIVNISQNCSRQLRNITRIYNKTVFFHVMPPQIKSPWEIAVQNQGGWAPKTGSFYTGVFPLWLGSTGEGCDPIQVSGCQTRAWRSTFYTLY